MQELIISKQYPVGQYNLLGNTAVTVEIPDIKSPVIQAIELDPVPGKGDVYIQQKAKKEYTDRKGTYHPATPDMYAITKIGLGKLAEGAGITMVSTEHVLPTTCRKCVAVNQGVGKVIQCGNCRNRDIALKVTISVPQLTGTDLVIADTNEINVDAHTASMTANQKSEFLRYMPEICEAKALNGAIRTALHIKGTYTREELMKPFVVAYLVPNLNHPDVKKAAIDNMFGSTAALFGTSPINKPVGVPKLSDLPNDMPEDIDQFIDGTYMSADGTVANEVVAQEIPAEPAPYGMPEQQQPDVRPVHRCSICGIDIDDRVYDFSTKRMGRPLCRKCQREVRR